MKHTSGPWKLRPPSLTGFAIDTPKGMFLVSCSGIPKREEWEANGKLIAAAPTMYDYIERQAERGDKEANSILSQLLLG